MAIGLIGHEVTVSLVFGFLNFFLCDDVSRRGKVMEEVNHSCLDFLGPPEYQIPMRGQIASIQGDLHLLGLLPGLYDTSAVDTFG